MTAFSDFCSFVRLLPKEVCKCSTFWTKDGFLSHCCSSLDLCFCDVDQHLLIRRVFLALLPWSMFNSDPIGTSMNRRRLLCPHFLLDDDVRFSGGGYQTAHQLRQSADLRFQDLDPLLKVGLRGFDSACMV